MRRGNIMIFTLIACAMMALVLIAGMQVASLRTANREDQIASLQLEQLHRSALAETLKGLNASGEEVSHGRVCLSDEPILGQRRQVVVDAVEERTLDLVSTSSLDDGSRRKHRVQLFLLPLEDRFAFSQSGQALYRAIERDVPTRWLEQHVAEDIVILCDDWRRSTATFSIGDGGTCALAGSMVVTHFLREAFVARLNVALTLEGNAIFEDDLHLAQDLSCQNAWIDGTLTVGESVRLVAETVYLGEDVPEKTLAQIDAATIYMPHPPEPEAPGEDEEEEGTEEPETGGKEILPLPSEPRPAPTRTLYLMLQQLE